MEDDYSDYEYDYDIQNYDYSTDYGGTEIDNPALPGQEGYGWKYYSDGTAISPTGQYYYDGKLIWSPSGGGGLSGIAGGAIKGLMDAFKKPSGGVDWQKVATVGGGLAGLLGLGNSEQKPVGYQGKIPEYTAVRERVEDQPELTTMPIAPETPKDTEAPRRPGSSGQRYFSDVRFAKKGEEEAARTAAKEEAAGLAALNARKNMASGGITTLKKGQYLNGSTDGMADKLSTTIDNKQPAALSHGEFVIPADVVSHLGNGNSEAGAKKLYEMMAKIRKARTGNPEQGKQINPNKYLPA